MSDLKIVYQDLSALKVRARNPRTHSEKQIKQIANSISAFGFTNPILVDGSNTIIAGHGRVEAAKRLAMRQVPTLRFDHMTQAQIRAYVIADNKLAENAGWDEGILAIELQELSLEQDIDITITGFETAEIDLLIGGLEGAVADEADEVPDIDPSVPAVTRRGDIWRIGDHRLMCGDSLDEEVCSALLGDSRAQMVFVDPPYNVRIEGHVSGLGHVKHREFAMASGEMTSQTFTGFLRDAFANLAKFSSDGSIQFVCMDWRHVGEVLQASAGVYAEFKNLCVWAKTNAGMGSLYRSQHELVFVFKNGTKPHINNVELGKHGRYRTNVWSYAGANSFGKDRDEELSMHPTVKPVALVADAILDCSRRGGIVLDSFAGSGTTLIAAEKTGRRGYGVELDVHYVDTIIKRFKSVYGLEATHDETGLGFDALGNDRPLDEEAADVG
jgi:DNA modification methylase